MLSSCGVRVVFVLSQSPLLLVSSWYGCMTYRVQKAACGYSHQFPVLDCTRHCPLVQCWTRPLFKNICQVSREDVLGKSAVGIAFVISIGVAIH